MPPKSLTKAVPMFSSQMFAFALFAAFCPLSSPLAQGNGHPAVQAALELPDWAASLNVRFDPDSGRLLRLDGSAPVSGPLADETAAGGVALDVLQQLGTTLAPKLTSWRVTAARQVASLYKVELEQRLFGRRVIDARVDLVLDTEGNLRSLLAGGVALEHPLPTFPIAANEAAELARKAPLDLGPGTYAYGLEEVFARTDAALRAAWQATVIDPGIGALGGGSWRIVIDAVTGEELARQSLSTGSVSGTKTGRWIASGGQTFGGPPVATAMTSLHVTGFDSDDSLFRATTNGCFDGHSQMSDDGMRIVWTSTCDGDEEVWTSLIDGSSALKLTDNADRDWDPVLSADGSLIVFTSNRDGNTELYAIASDGAGLVRLTVDGGTDTNASMDLAGTFVVFTSNRSGNDDLWRVNTDGTGLAQITTDPGKDYAAALAGNGTMIGFLSNRDGDTELFVHEIAGASTTQITFDDLPTGRPSIANSGTLLAFTSLAPSADAGVGTASPAGQSGLGGARNGGVRPLARPWQVWLAASDGSLVEPLTSGGHGYGAPALSGDGLAIGYLERRKIGNPTLVIEDLASGSILSLGEVQRGTQPDLAEDALRGTFVRTVDSPEVFTWDFTVGTALQTVTSGGGLWSLDFVDGSAPSITARLRGLWARVKDLASGSRDQTILLSTIAPSTGNDAVFNATGTAEYRTAQVTAYQHTTNAHDALGGILSSPRLALPLPLPIDEQLRVEVNAPGGVRNAFYDGARETARYFAGTGPDAPNTAIDSVLYHEYGHFADHQYDGFIRNFSEEHPLAVSEAFGDAMAFYGLGTYLLGDGWSGAGTWIRNYGLPGALGGSSDRNYECLGCDVDPDYPGVPESHDHGEALAGFFADIALLAPDDAAELTFGALAMNPISMPEAVAHVFMLGGTAPFCGPCADVSEGPLYEPICIAAASHGFECTSRPDKGSKGCFESFCPGMPAEHRSTGTEWLGFTVDGNDVDCLPSAPDDDGVILTSDPISGAPLDISVAVSVNPLLLGSGRYKRDPIGDPVPSRLLFLHAFVYVEVMAGVWVDTHVLGSGSGTPALGNVAFGGFDTIAFDPEAFGAPFGIFDFSFDLPEVPGFAAAALRVRLDYGEDGGAIPHPEASGTYSGPCGLARFGEVEDYPFGIAPVR